MMARAAWGAAKDAQAQVAFWRSVAEASEVDILQARECVETASKVFTRTVHVYAHVSGMKPSAMHRLA